jgi:hypothetical protein
LAVILGAVLFGGDFVWDKTIKYILLGLLAVFFFAMLVSNQQYEEDAMAKIERIGSAAFFSFIIFFQMLYAPLAGYFFGMLIRQKIFLTEFLALFLFLLFLFLFAVSTMVASSFSLTGFLTRWTVFNNPTAYFVLRNLWLAAAALLVFLFLQSPFVIISVN